MKDLTKQLNMLSSALFSIEDYIVKRNFKNINVYEIRTINVVGEKSMFVTEVANCMNLTLGTITISINSIIKKGYMKKVSVSNDKRKRIVSLTEEGIEIYKSYNEMFYEIYRKSFGVFNEKEQKKFNEIIRKLSIDLKIASEKTKLKKLYNFCLGEKIEIYSIRNKLKNYLKQYSIETYGRFVIEEINDYGYRLEGNVTIFIDHEDLKDIMAIKV